MRAQYPRAWGMITTIETASKLHQFLAEDSFPHTLWESPPRKFQGSNPA
jgi:hypothetical protein